MKRDLTIIVPPLPFIIRIVLCVLTFQLLGSTADAWESWHNQVIKLRYVTAIDSQSQDYIWFGVSKILPQKEISAIRQEIERLSARRNIRYDVTGEFVSPPPLPSIQKYTGVYRPTVPGGVSIGHVQPSGEVDVTAGTLGAWVAKDGLVGILSNNHILANSNRGSVGDPIVQPGAYDICWPPPDNGNGNDNGCLFKKILRKKKVKPHLEVDCLDYQIGTLLSWININFEGGNNLVDCAFAVVTDPSFVPTGAPDDPYILGLSHGLTHIRRPIIDERVYKVGRTTEYTKSTIPYIDATVKVSYKYGQTAIFVRQVISAGAMGAGGDSGSIIFAASDGAGVAHLFAGSDEYIAANWLYYTRDFLEFDFLQ